MLFIGSVNMTNSIVTQNLILQIIQSGNTFIIKP